MNQESGYCPLQCSGARRVRTHPRCSNTKPSPHRTHASNTLIVSPRPCSPAGAFDARSRRLGPPKQGCTPAASPATTATGRSSGRSSGHRGVHPPQVCIALRSSELVGRRLRNSGRTRAWCYRSGSSKACSRRSQGQEAKKYHLVKQCRLLFKY